MIEACDYFLPFIAHHISGCDTAKNEISLTITAEREGLKADSVSAEKLLTWPDRVMMVEGPDGEVVNRPGCISK